MPIQLSFRSALQTLATLAGPDSPPHIAVQAACRLVDLLSPSNPRYAEILLALHSPDPDEETNSEEDDDPL